MHRCPIKFRTGIWKVWALVLLSAISLNTFPVAAAEVSKPDLKGTVLDSDGIPLIGATVFVYSAAPKEGAGIICPYCYDDCRKREYSGLDGSFLIKELDPKLKFNLLATAPGYRPKIVSNVDPLGKPAEIKLKKQSVAANSQQKVSGKVLDSEGKPVVKAVVSLKSITRGTTTRYGPDKADDPLAVTDENGLFTLNSTQPFDQLSVEVEAPGLAKAIFNRLATGDIIHELRMTEGVTITGRVLKDGKPLAGIEIGVSGAERWAEVFIGRFFTGTSEDGRFSLVNIPPSRAYQLYGTMKSLQGIGVLETKVIRPGADGTKLDVGDLEVTPGYVVAGKVVLTDASTLPYKAKVFLSREGADGQQTETDEQGRFRFSDVPGESVSISTRIGGYRYSSRNASLDPLNKFSLIGTVFTNKTNLTIEMEPGVRTDDQLDGNQTALRKEPIRGVEGGGRLGEIEVTGQVLDADTGKPLAQFNVIEGRRDQYQTETINWYPSRKTAGQQGSFKINMVKQQQPSAVMVVAEDYLPQASGSIYPPGTNLVFKLQKGSGPAAVVKSPSGKALAGVTVYLSDMKNGVYVDGDLKVRTDMYRGTKSTTTDKDGRFAFPPIIDAFAVHIMDEAGYAEVRVDELRADPVIVLRPWARVEGRLFIGKKPGAGESVRLWPAHVPYAYSPRSFDPLQLYLRTTTDADGRFVFERVPPIDVELYHAPEVKDSRMGTTPMSQTVKMTLRAGALNEVILGGQGRPVIGRFVVNGYKGKIDWRQDVVSLETVVETPPGIKPFQDIVSIYNQVSRAAKTPEEKTAARQYFDQERAEYSRQLKEFYHTEEGKKLYFNRRRFVLDFKQDGTFRAEDVPAGKYTLRLDLRDSSDPGPSRYSAPVIVNHTMQVEVPPIPGGRSDEPLDIGTTELVARNSVSYGMVAPEFAVKTLEGKTIKLSDFKGKYVLLDFWAVWCGPCVAETPYLKEAYELIKDNPKFVMIGLSLDPEKEAPIEYTKKNQLKWIQGFLGDWSKTDLPTKYGVQGIPSIMLIGPSGKVMQSNLRGEEIATTVKRAIEMADK